MYLRIVITAIYFFSGFQKLANLLKPQKMKKSIYLSLLLFSASQLFAQDPAVYKLRLSLSLLDVPQNLKSTGNFPSMMQSAELSSSLYDISFWGIDAAGNAIIKNRNSTFAGKAANTGLKYLLGLGFSYYGSELPIPLGVYTHEEFHRSVLGVNAISSINGNWFLNRWDGTVYGLSDEVLSGLKANSINNLLYSYVSGIQSENYLTQVNVIEDFYHPRTFYKNPLYLYHAYYVWDYFRFSASSLSDSVKVNAPPHEDSNPFNRDFAGADLTAWIYDMFSPDAPYTYRDYFPGGEGVNRRIGFSDLSMEGRDYLKKQKQLSLLNFANPAIFLINRIKVTPDFSFLAFMQYSPAHFGNDIALYVPFRIKTLNQLVVIHNYNNKHKKFPGFQYGIYNLSPFVNRKMELGATLSLWVQPVDQGFFDQTGKLGGAIEMTSDYNIGRGFSVNLTAGYKTAGWMTGNPYLDENAKFRVGIKYFLKD